MARSIVLRYDATCFDCGRPLAAGTTARWFGKGRVSCCGTPDSARSARQELDSLRERALAAAAPEADVSYLIDACRRQIESRGYLPDSDEARALYRLANPRPAAPTPAPADPESARRARIESDAVRLDVDAERLFCGLSVADVATLATKAPTMLLLARLSSGARLLVPAEHAAHVLRCIEESCVDRVCDVTRSPHQ